MALDHSQLVLVQFHPVSLKISQLPQLYLRKFVSTKRIRSLFAGTDFCCVYFVPPSTSHVGEGLWEHFYSTLGDKCAKWHNILARLIFDVFVCLSYLVDAGMFERYEPLYENALLC